MMRYVGPMLLVFVLSGCFAPPAGIDFGIEKSRATEAAYDVLGAYADSMHAANQAFYALKMQENLRLYREQLYEEATPGEVEVRTETGEIEVVTKPKISADRAAELLAMFAHKWDDVSAARAKDQRLYDVVVRTLADAREIEAAWVRYLVETSPWNERQKALLNTLMAELGGQ